MSKHRLLGCMELALALALVSIPWGLNSTYAGPGTRAGADVSNTPSAGTFYAHSPAGIWNYINANKVVDPFHLGPSDSGTPLRKFVDSLPGLGPSGVNNLGNFIPLATPIINPNYPGDDYYEIGLVDYTQQMHSDLPKKTQLRGYKDLSQANPNGSNYLGPFIIATKNRPVRIKFSNMLGVSTDTSGNLGNLFIPVDTTAMGAGAFTIGDANDPASLISGFFTENRASVHLHGGFTPWISDGTPHQWITPPGEVTSYAKGLSFQNVPDMVGAGKTIPTPSAGDGLATLYYPNAQSGRLMFYHDHAYGLTRLNVYAGEAAGYLLVDPAEETTLAQAGVPGTYPADQAHMIPLIIQDKTFIPKDISVQDTRWTGHNSAPGTYGDLWFPHVYEPNQWPSSAPHGGNPDGSGTNPFGRWDYGPWFWPIFPVAPENYPLPDQRTPSAPSLVPEAFMDTPVVNGTAYPYLDVQPTAYRFRILNACNDRTLNLQLYQADPNVSVGTAGLTEVKMVPAVPPPDAELAVGFSTGGTELYMNGAWSEITSGNPTVMAYSPTMGTLFANFGISGLWKYQGGTWSQVSGLNARSLLIAGSLLYVDVGTSGIYKYDGANFTQVLTYTSTQTVYDNIRGILYVACGASGVYRYDGVNPAVQITNGNCKNMVLAGSTLYGDFGADGIWKYSGNGTDWGTSRITPATAKTLIAVGTTLYGDFGSTGIWKYSGNGTDWGSPITPATAKTLIAVGTTLYGDFGSTGIWKYSGNGTDWGGSPITPATAKTLIAVGTTLYGDFGSTGIWKYNGNGTDWGGSPITPASADRLVASDTTIYGDFGADGLWKYLGADTNWTKLSTAKPGVMTPVAFSGSWPATWPTDGRDGGVPDPNTRGPAIVQIGTEGGLLPAPAVINNQPIGYEYNRRSVTVLNVSDHSLYMGPAERADVVIDFTPYAGKTLILYNDAPAPVPAFDSRNDYYTGNPDQTSTGGAPTTRPGYGPNTRTIMQIRVAGTPSATPPPVNYYNQTLVNNLNSTLPSLFAAELDPLPVVEPGNYANIFTGSSTSPTLDFITDQSLTYRVIADNSTINGPLTYYLPSAPTTPVSLGSGASAVVPANTKVMVEAGNLAQIQPQPKAIQELFDNLGRMNSTLGTEIPFTNNQVQTTIPLQYIDPATEILIPGEVQVWKITHNGVDTHSVHFHLVNVQVINRVGWDGTVKPPDFNEMGWKETVKMNPLEDIYVALRPAVPPIPTSFGTLPHSVRPLDVTMPLNSTGQFTSIDPTTNAPINPPVSNVLADFGWEYVWHCHLLGHEENDMMRPIIFQVP